MYQTFSNKNRIQTLQDLNASSITLLELPDIYAAFLKMNFNQPMSFLFDILELLFLLLLVMFSSTKPYFLTDILCLLS